MHFFHTISSAHFHCGNQAIFFRGRGVRLYNTGQPCCLQQLWQDCGRVVISLLSHCYNMVIAATGHIYGIHLYNMSQCIIIPYTMQPKHRMSCVRIITNSQTIPDRHASLNFDSCGSALFNSSGDVKAFHFQSENTTDKEMQSPRGAFSHTWCSKDKNVLRISRSLLGCCMFYIQKCEICNWL